MASPPGPLPALSLVASPGKRQAVIAAAQEAERRGFAGIACPMLGGALGLCASLAHATDEIPFWTAIQGIYSSHANELGTFASHVAEVSGGRFRLGLGVSHDAMNKRLGVPPATSPLSDVRSYVDALRANERFGGPLPPIYLAAMRDRMVDLALNAADGVLWANAALSYTAGQAARARKERPDAFLANMIPTVIDEDIDAALAVQRKTLTTYVRLPNYRNYWRAAGYVEEMDALEAAAAAGERDRLPELMSDAWLRDCTISGTVEQVRAGFEEWMDAGVRPIAVMSSTSGGQLKAVAELFAAYT
jgi:alkanesulfonate monooxygenase SsuD/methylene tetrahydromethanopterin reductase-like flavin-dependent oxidoreductase (luciferase family)